MRVQRQLIAVRQSADLTTIRRRFEDELLPRRRDLEGSLNQLVVHKEAEIKDVYRQAAVERDRLAKRLYGLLGVLTLAGLAVTWFFAEGSTRAPQGRGGPGYGPKGARSLAMRSWASSPTICEIRSARSR